MGNQAVPAGEAAGEEGMQGDAVGMIDLSGVPDEQAFPVVPRGIYPAVVDELTYGLSQSSGNPMWTWRLEISEGEHAGRKLFFHSPFTENMLPRLKKVLSRVAPELLNGPFDPRAIAESGVMIGKSCQVRVDVKPYNGQQRSNVRDILPPAEGAGAEAFV